MHLVTNRLPDSITNPRPGTPEAQRVFDEYRTELRALGARPVTPLRPNQPGLTLAFNSQEQELAAAEALLQGVIGGVFINIQKTPWKALLFPRTLAELQQAVADLPTVVSANSGIIGGPFRVVATDAAAGARLVNLFGSQINGSDGTAKLVVSTRS